MNVPCDYCGRPAALVEGSEVYPHRPDLDDKQYRPDWAYNQALMVPDSAGEYVKHADVVEPDDNLDTAAGRDLDAIAGSRLRDGLSDAEFRRRLCHIGMFDVAMCRWVVVHCKDYQRTKQSPR